MCKEKKDKAAGKEAFDLLKSFGKNQKYSNPSKLAQDVSKAQSKFTKAFSKADALGPCPVPGDQANVDLAVDGGVGRVMSLIDGGPPAWPCGNGVLDGGEQCDPPAYGGATCGTLGFNLDGTLGCTAACQYDVSGCECQEASPEALPATGQTTAYQADKNDGILGPVDVPDDGWVEAGATLAYVDNGDGTISDLNTGLMWEKKSDDSGLHDKDVVYLWSGNGNQETIWDWLDDVNTEPDYDSPGHAGYSDWRIPNVRELQSIIDYGRYSPSVNPVFNTGCTAGCTVTTCSCTQASFYWSSTTGAYGPSGGWVVAFYDGDVVGSDKHDVLYVRAVRGGS